MKTRCETIKAQLQDSGLASRPILTYVNGDVSWLISFPRPTAEVEEPSMTKKYYHAVLDPWFRTPAIQFASLLLTMQHGRPPGIGSREELDRAIVEIEASAGHDLKLSEYSSAVDGVFVMGFAADHCHKDSLLEFPPNTDVFASSDAIKMMRCWNHFASVIEIPSFDPRKSMWPSAHLGPALPSWLTVFKPTTAYFNNFGLAMITSIDPAHHELLLFAPHGFYASEASIHALAEARAAPEVSLLALVAPLKDSYALGMSQVASVAEAMKIAQYFDMRYFVRNGDFVSLKYGGVISYTVKDIPRDMQYGLDQVRQQLRGARNLKKPMEVEVGNGDSYVLL
jgi:hypothetical protein